MPKLKSEHRERLISFKVYFYSYLPCPFTGRKMFCAGPNFLCQSTNSSIYKSLFLSKFFVRVTARSKTMFFKPTTPLDGEKSSLWTSNFWAKSFLPFDLYHGKSCKNGEISTRPQIIILLKTRSIFFRKPHNR